MSVLLGIDTGGTYTDAVLVNDNRDIVASAKSLTTRHDLSQGINDALNQLPPENLPAVSLICLSTTLTTNAVVEGQGAPVCVLLAGLDDKQVQRSRLREVLRDDPIVIIAGSHNAQGMELQALDELAARRTILAQRDKVSAFAVSAMFGVRNPAHELKLRQMILELTGKPVTCGHELSSKLDAPRRALTAALNARLVPYIQQLIAAVQRILEQHRIHAPLMVVKGDGSLVNVKTALQRPVETVLSGPAASVIGACALSGLSNTVVADMGGTTTDIAVVSNGRPAVNPEGAIIGDWRPMVEAVQVYSIGLGGDSEVRFSGGEGLAIGPRRVLPMSLLAQQYPAVLARLERQLKQSSNPRHNKFALRLHHNEVQLRQLSVDEKAAWESLAQGPVELDHVVQNNRLLARALARLERLGLVIYSGFTPSDAAHVLDLCGHWSRPAAELAAKIWARQMRRIYGYSQWSDDDAIEPSREVVEKVIESITRKLLEAGLHRQGYSGGSKTAQLSQLLTELILKADQTPDVPPLFKLSFAADYPLVAVGAPAASYYPEAAARLKAGLHIPPHAEVASAIGAVMGSVIQKAHIIITQSVVGIYRVHTQAGPKDFDTLELAVIHAEGIATATAEQSALAAGAASVQTVLSRRDNGVDDAIDGHVFFDATITATASGRPKITDHDAVHELAPH